MRILLCLLPLTACAPAPATSSTETVDVADAKATAKRANRRADEMIKRLKALPAPVQDTAQSPPRR